MPAGAAQRLKTAGARVAPQLASHQDVLRAQNLSTERGIGYFRAALALISLVTDIATVTGVVKAGFDWPVVTVAIDVVWAVTAGAVVWLLRRARSVGAAMLAFCVTLDFVFVNLSMTVYIAQPGSNRDAMLMLGAGANGLLLAMSAQRLSAATTVYATALSLGWFFTTAALLGTSADNVVGGTLLIGLTGALCANLSRRFWHASRMMAERSRLAQFLPREVADSLGDDHNSALSGREAVVTVLFSDLAGFTALSENLPPAEVVALLNDYRARITRVVFDHLGTLDKFVGDATMAVFGAPVSRPDDAARALRCAKAMVQALADLNAERAAAGLQPLGAGIGIHTGRVVAGNIGSAERLEYTVIGDTVNVAARVESLTRKFGAEILCTAATRDAAGDGFQMHPLGSVEVKGRSQAVEVFAVQ